MTDQPKRDTAARIARAVKGALDAGLHIAEVVVSIDGDIRILSKPDESPKAERKPQQW